MNEPMALGAVAGSNAAGVAAVGSLYPPGAAVLRLIQMYDAMSGAGSVNEGQTLNLAYWKAFVQEFFVADGFFRQVAWNPSAREQRAFELPVSVLARYLHTVHLSGAVSTAVTLSHPREWQPASLRTVPPPPQTKRSMLGQPNPRTTHFVQVERAKMTIEYDNGWIVVQRGLLRAGLTPFAGQLRFQFVDFLVTDHESYVSKTKMRRGIAEQPLSEDLIAEIRGQKPAASAKRDGKKEKKEDSASAASGGAKGAAADDGEGKPRVGNKRDEERFTCPVEKWNMPENPVNEYGMTLRSMRCLEITESVCQLRGLMDYAAQHTLGPMDALHKLAEDFRASKPKTSSGGAVGTTGPTSPSGSSAGSTTGDSSSSSNKRKATPQQGAGGSTSGQTAKMEDADDGQGAGESESPNKRAR